MTACQMWLKLTMAILKGYGNAPVLFDTEATEWQTHMVDVDNVGCESQPEKHVGLSTMLGHGG